MEIQSGQFLNEKNKYFKNKLPCLIINPQKIIFQPSGINTKKISPQTNYARIIFEPSEYLDVDFSKTGLKIFDNAIREQIQLSCGIDYIKIVKWNGTKVMNINGTKMFKTSYLRQIGNNPVVNVEIYYFQIAQQKGYSITYSYRLENNEMWGSKFKESANSLKLNR